MATNRLHFLQRRKKQRGRGKTRATRLLQGLALEEDQIDGCDLMNTRGTHEFLIVELDRERQRVGLGFARRFLEIHGDSGSDKKNETVEEAHGSNFAYCGLLRKGLAGAIRDRFGSGFQTAADTTELVAHGL